MLRKIWSVTRRRDPKSEAEIGRIAAESPVTKMPLRRRLAWAAAMLVIGSITTVAFALVFWPRDHAATLFSVGVIVGSYLPFVALVLGVALIVLAGRIPAVAATSVDGVPRGTSTAAAVPPTSPFAGLVATVRAPVYAGGKSVRIESPASITALVGSTVTLDAPGSSAGISVDIGDARHTVQGGEDRWTSTFTVGPKPTLVRLRHSSGERIIALEPRPDSVPAVRLLTPLRDTVMRVARGSMSLSAEVHEICGRFPVPGLPD